MATDIKFYHLTRQPLEVALPMLVGKAWEQRIPTVIRASDEARVRSLDTLLWTYDDESFLPHGTARSPTPEALPVYLTAGSEVPNGATLLMLVDNRLDEDVGRFAKCHYLFDGRDDARVAQARQHWTALKAEGHTLSYWQQNDEGRWQQKA